MLVMSPTGSLSSLTRYTTMELIYSEDAGKCDGLTADVDADLAGETKKEYSTMGVAARLEGSP